jgi:hypothetical protein
MINKEMDKIDEQYKKQKTIKRWEIHMRKQE